MIEVVRVPKEEWAPMSEDAHRISFKENKPADWDRIDFALLGTKEGLLTGYVTCREHDAKTLYWQFGGAMPMAKDSITSFMTLQAFFDWSKTNYDRITCLVENTNTVMLKMAIKLGFRIVGIRTFKQTVLLEHLIEFHNG